MTGGGNPTTRSNLLPLSPLEQQDEAARLLAERHGPQPARGQQSGPRPQSTTGDARLDAHIDALVGVLESGTPPPSPQQRSDQLAVKRTAAIAYAEQCNAEANPPQPQPPPSPGEAWLRQFDAAFAGHGRPPDPPGQQPVALSPEVARSFDAYYREASGGTWGQSPGEE